MKGELGMFNKSTVFSIGKNDFEILDGDLLKTAALKLPDGVVYDPDFLYIKVRGVSAGEYWGCNKNFDYFPEAELLTGYKTFLTAHTFKNHENKDIKNAIGDVLSADWNDKMKSVELLLRIDRKVAPTVVRGFEKGFMTDVSMGCRVSHSVCSICGNKAKTKFEYCDHIKMQRGKVLNDGRKVYEINIGPKFHDISAVLTGAERCAKVTNIMIVGDKVASVSQDGDIEKVASFEESFDNFETLARSNDANNEFAKDIDLDMNFGKKLDKKAYIKKIADIKKEIQGKMIGVAEGNFLSERQEKVEKMQQLFKLLHENYWDRNKCYDIAMRLKSFAAENNVPLESAFDQFLKVLNFSGIELTPAEFHDISSKLMGTKSPDIRNINTEDCKTTEDCVDNMESAEQCVSENSMDESMNLPSLFKTIMDKFIPNQDKIISSTNLFDGDPLKKTKAVIVMLKKRVPSISDEGLQTGIMRHIVKPLLPERSAHREFLIPRVLKVASEDSEIYTENTKHYMPIHIMNQSGELQKTASTALPFILSGLMYSTYQAERVASFMNGSLAKGIDKFASEIYDVSDIPFVKTASKKPYGVGKALLVGVPATYIYSGVQRARINNGKRVNTFNRFLAESPGSAALAQVAFAPLISKGITGAKSIKDGKTNVAESIDEILVNKFAHCYEQKMAKSASFDNVGQSLYNKDMFGDTNIDNVMLSKYSQEQLNTIKQACLLTALQKESTAEDMLLKKALREEDIEEYLKIAVDCIKIEIEKTASDGTGKSLAVGVLSDMLFNPKGTSMLATLPGNLIDSIVFSKLLGKGKETTQSPTKL